jgi:uncharacterized protein (TIGR00251 family)
MTALTVRVTPRASRDSLARYEGGVLHVRVTAPPAGGEANAAVAKLLASALGLASRDVVLVGGAASRVKRFELPIGHAELERRIASALEHAR